MTRPHPLAPFVAAAMVAAPGLSPAPALGQEKTGEIHCQVNENGSPASGTIILSKGDGQEVARGSCGSAPLQVPPGRYRARLRLDGALDRPEKTRSVSVQAGDSERVSADFPTGVLEVRIETEGRRAAGMATIYRDGERVGPLGSGVSAHLSAGTYDVVVRYRSNEKRFEDVRLQAGQHRRLSAQF